MKWTRATLLASLALLAGCGAGEPPPPTVVLCVWDSVDVEELHLYGAEVDTTPVLTGLGRGGRVFDPHFPASTSANACLTELLTGLPSTFNGMFSLHEPGYQRIKENSVYDLKRWHDEGWRTLASVSLPQLGGELTGLGIAFDSWKAPDFRTESGPRSASEVVEAIRPELREALRSEQTVLLLLHFGDLRGNSWRGRKDVDPWLEVFLKPWRGKGGEVDEAWAASEDEGPLLDRLSRRLLRRRDDPRRAALLRAIYAAGLSRLDAALGEVLGEIEEAGRTANTTVAVVGGPIALPGAAGTSGGEPQPRARSLRVHWDRGETGLSIPARPSIDAEVLMHALPPNTILSALVVDYPEAVHEAGFHDTLTGTHYEIDEEGKPFPASRGAQRLRFHHAGAEGAELDISVYSPADDLDLLREGDGEPRPPRARSRRFDLSSGSDAEILPARRAVELLLTLRGEGLSLDQVAIGETLLEQLDVPELLARQTSPWPEPEEGAPARAPVLDLQPLPGRRLSVAVEAGAEVEVRMLLERFPLDRALEKGLAGAGLKVEPHPRRPGAVWVEGRGALRCELPPQLPSTRLGVALFLDGTRVAAKEIRYEKRRFGQPGELELGLGVGAWSQEELRGSIPEESAARVALELVDPLLGPSDRPLPSPEALEFLSRLGANE